MARTTITLNDEVLKQLQKYIDEHYGSGRKVLSMVIERAIKEFLKKEGGKE